MLYELLTGRPAFPGETVSDVLAAVLQNEPDWTALAADTPASIRRLIRRCLIKDVRRRLRDIGDALVELEDSAEDPAAAMLPAAAIRRSQRSALVVSIAATAAVVPGLSWLAMGLVSSSSDRGSAPARFDVRSLTGDPYAPQLSPDGSTLAFTASERPFQIYVRPMDGLVAEPVTTGREGAFVTDFSPDGQWLLITAQGPGSQLERVPLAGGPAVPIAPSDGRMATWGATGTIVVGSREGLLSVPDTGGDLVRLTSVAEGEEAHFFPRFLPDGRAVLFEIWTGDRETAQVAPYDVETGESRRLVAGMAPRYAASGHLIFWRYDALWAVAFDVDSRAVSGTPIPVVDGVTAMFDGLGHYTVGGDGALVYWPVTEVRTRRSLVWVARDGTETPVSAAPRPYGSVRISPDGRKAVVDVLERGTGTIVEAVGNTDLWLLEDDGILSRFTDHPADDRDPVWSPDGARVYFGSTRDNDALNLFSKAVGGGAVTRLWSPDPGLQIASDVVPETGEVLYWQGGAGIGDDRGLQLASPDEDPHGANALLQSSVARLSPNGRWLAVASTETGQSEVRVHPFPNVDEGRWSVSEGLGASPVWGPDGRELFFQTRKAADGPVSLMVVTVEGGGVFRSSTPATIFEGRFTDGITDRITPYDVHPDGQRFLMVKEDPSPPEPPRLIVVQDWFDELRERVPVP